MSGTGAILCLFIAIIGILLLLVSLTGMFLVFCDLWMELGTDCTIPCIAKRQCGRGEMYEIVVVVDLLPIWLSGKSVDGGGFQRNNVHPNVPSVSKFYFFFNEKKDFASLGNP